MVGRCASGLARACWLQLKSAWRDATTHIKISPLEFMQRLAALVPRPRLRLIRFPGVLAPNA
ncbi:MAG: transposase, partial [Betaproteobacteria bacterium]|nr:transposase [Betaproteobacteria bacterium]